MPFFVYVNVQICDVVTVFSFTYNNYFMTLTRQDCAFQTTKSDFNIIIYQKLKIDVYHHQD